MDPSSVDYRSYLGSEENFGENLEALQNAYPGLILENPEDPREFSSLRAQRRREEKEGANDYFSASLEELRRQAQDMGFQLVEVGKVQRAKKPKVEKSKTVKPRKAKPRKKVEKTHKVQSRQRINWTDPEEAVRARGWGLTRAFKYYPVFADD